ncbi:pyridoxamine 5'-phosphate oxidase family protein [Methylobacterium sp. SyP6R]|uniref:pyridoxamine 5'-phosphate oxidase family protein n=1 Tax=Methylobacterium sp. SyP6R TaxID=2718876 RepID=UPI001F2FF4FC|nr:pyridoxamine 5'-phosphate oxidase family protein [Methylobacterium sp. SyP6R]MCF4130074.1 pyridoxamine 5'-phosphate oxidase family protein [Methylobacterium sp. SyP6R]
MCSSKRGALLNEAVRIGIENSVLCWLATVDEAGNPNVSPKEIFVSHGNDRILVADIASPTSVRNIAAHPSVCVSFVDVFRQRGFKVHGRASLITRGSEAFETTGADLLKKAGPDFPVRTIISVRIERIASIRAPSYALFPERTEAERMRAAYDTYKVEPRSV